MSSTNIKQESYLKNYFSINIKYLRLASLWYPSEIHNVKDIAAIMMTIFMTMLTTFYTPSEIISLPEQSDDINAFINNLGIALSHIIGSIKLYNFCFHRSQLKKLMQTLEDEDLEYEITEDFKPNEIIDKAKKQNVFTSNGFSALVHLVLWSNYLMAIFNFIFRPNSYYSVDRYGNSVFCTNLPFYSWIPFYHGNKATCLVAIFFQLLCVLFLSLVIIGADMLFVGLINFVTAHVLVLQGAFKSIPMRSLKKSGSQELDQVMQREMKKCVDHLNLIFRVCADLENIYKYQTLAQVLVSLFVTCTCMFLLATEEIGSRAFFLQLTYVSAIMMQITMYCWFGNELQIASVGLPSALYHSQWFDASQVYKKSMLNTMMRMRKPIIMTIGNFSSLTLDSLVLILRGAYSLLAVLKKKNSIEDN